MLNTVSQLLVAGGNILTRHNLPEPYADAQVLLASVLGCNRVDLFIDTDRHIDEEKRVAYMDFISQRIEHVPLCYLTGKKEFMGFNFKILPGVFIPRPETELLVEEVIKIVNPAARPEQRCGTNKFRLLKNPRKSHSDSDVTSEEESQLIDERDPSTSLRMTPLKKPFNGVKLLDIGTGCGNIAISLSLFLPWTKIYAVDIDPLCISLAKTNATLLGADEDTVFFEGDLFQPVYNLGFKHKFDLVVSNPPYISKSEIDTLQPEILREPRLAIDGGIDGLEFYRRIIKESKVFLSDNGFIALEVGYNQLEKVYNMLKQEGYIVKYTRKDYSGFDRIVIAGL